MRLTRLQYIVIAGRAILDPAVQRAYEGAPVLGSTLLRVCEAARAAGLPLPDRAAELTLPTPPTEPHAA
jgi:hypothetical protein